MRAIGERSISERAIRLLVIATSVPVKGETWHGGDEFEVIVR